MLGDVNKLFVFKSLLTTPSNVLPLHLKQTFPPIIWIFTEGDRIKSRLPLKYFLLYTYLSHCILKWNFLGHSKTTLDYEFCDNEAWPKHKLSAFPILVISCYPIEPILCWIVCQESHPLGMKMLHIDLALKKIIVI